MAYSDIASKQYGGLGEVPPVSYDTIYPSGHHLQQGPGYQNLPSGPVLPATDLSEERKDPESESDSEAGKIPVEHLKLDFEDCFREHKSTKLFDPIYKVYSIAYKYTKLVFYHLLVLVIGFPLAIAWALINAVTAFTYTWLWGPVMKIWLLWIYGITPLFTAPIRAFMRPLVDVMARVFRQIKVHVATDGKLAEAIGALGRSKAV